MSAFMRELWPGTRVIVFDPTLYVNDTATPPSVTMREATVLRWYGKRSEFFGVYPNLVDVRFDHDGRESQGHFGDRL
ncbi:MAG TPA: hypothetical protein VGR95_12485 [Thermoanaerobaculia bacterium]|jgi:hypothetical protein|nr:hypothetical protein [Thermoanaerobaculia bacterium]